MIRTPGIYANITNESYHADKAWLSSSQIKVALDSAHSFDYFINKDLGEKKETSPAKNFGSLLHLLILEPHLFDSTYAALDMSQYDMRRKADKESVESFKEEHKGLTVIDAADLKRAMTCRESVMNHPDARRLLEMQGESEVSCYTEIPVMLPDGTDEQMKIRVRPDRLIRGGGIIDLKTTKNPNKDSFTRDAFAPWGYHYDLSAYMYTYAISILTGEVLPFYWIAVKNDHPYSCAVYKMSTETFLKGQQKFNKAVRTILMAKKENKWTYQDAMEEI